MVLLRLLFQAFSSDWNPPCLLLFLLEKLLRDVPGTADLAPQGQDFQPPPLWVPYPAFLVMPTLHSFPQLAPSWLAFLRSLQGSRQFQLRSQRESPKRNGKEKQFPYPPTPSGTSPETFFRALVTLLEMISLVYWIPANPSLPREQAPGGQGLGPLLST